MNIKGKLWIKKIFLIKNYKLKSIKMRSDEKYGKLEHLWEFGAAYCKEIKPAHKIALKPLSSSYSAKLWEKYVSTTQKHLMQIKKDAEANFKELHLIDYNWLEDWELDNYYAFKQKLAPLVTWDRNDKVYFFWKKSIGIETTWEVFCEYWIPFFYEDEANIIINSNDKKCIVFSSNGMIYIGTHINGENNYEKVI